MKLPIVHCLCVHKRIESLTCHCLCVHMRAEITNCPLSLCTQEGRNYELSTVSVYTRGSKLPIVHCLCVHKRVEITNCPLSLCTQEGRNYESSIVYVYSPCVHVVHWPDKNGSRKVRFKRQLCSQWKKESTTQWLAGWIKFKTQDSKWLYYLIREIKRETSETSHSEHRFPAPSSKLCQI